MAQKKAEKKQGDRGAKGISVTKEGNFSEWYSEVVQKAELADLRYNVKGFLVFQPWSVLAMEKMYALFEQALQRKGHKPYFFPTLIPESNLTKESEHVAGFTPEVFWVTHGGDKKFEERLALRPTSETAFYQMFSLWIRSYKDLPFKTYQRANVFRYETKATRPFLRSREFHWIETHCAFACKEDAEKQVQEDMQTTKEILHDILGLPFIFFERPAWDKFPGAERTFAADVLNPDGRVVQQPSTHVLTQAFPEAFDVKFKDADGKEKHVWITCYGPAVSRILASVIIVHGDNKGLRFPWAVAPVHVAIVPVTDDERILKAARILEQDLGTFASVILDTSDKSAGEKFNHWEMKGVPVRIDIGLKDLENKSATVFRRDLNTKTVVLLKDVAKHVQQLARESGKNLTVQADKVFEKRIADAGTIAQITAGVEAGGVVRCMLCSVDKDGAACAAQIAEATGAAVRGTRLEREAAKGNCVVCGKKAKSVVYIARQY